jgi:hypothetical protein
MQNLPPSARLVSGQPTRCRYRAPRLLLSLPPLLIFALFAPVDALGKGGTVMHDVASSSHAAVPSYQPNLPSSGFGACGRGRYHDPRTHKCRGPADFGN